MRRNVIWGGIFSFFAGCTTTSDNARPEIVGLREVSKEYLVETWGQPDFQKQHVNGQSVLRYNRVTATKEDPLTEKVIKSLCDIELVLDREGIVLDWKYLQCGNFK